MHIVNITQAKSQLSSLIKDVEEMGEEVIIGRAGKPIAKIIKYQPQQLNKRLSLFDRKIEIAEDFDELPDDIASSFGMN